MLWWPSTGTNKVFYHWDAFDHYGTGMLYMPVKIMGDSWGWQCYQMIMIRWSSYLVVAVLFEDMPAQVTHREEVVAQLALNLQEEFWKIKKRKKTSCQNSPKSYFLKNNAYHLFNCNINTVDWLVATFYLQQFKTDWWIGCTLFYLQKI